MDAVSEIAGHLPEEIARALLDRRDIATEIRLRSGMRPRIAFAGGDEAVGGPVSQTEIFRTVQRMLEHSLYAWEDELNQGFFTLPGGARVGVCGRYALERGEIRSVVYIQSVCVRVSREVPGAGRVLAGRICGNGDVKSALILSRPGLGKTTMLRDVVRTISDAGKNVSLIDERGEVAACRDGCATMDVGARTDVMDMCPKHIAISRMVRSMRPDVVAVDELGDARDVQAVLEARRSGVAILATAHARGISDALGRPALGDMLRLGAFDLVAVLAGDIGEVSEIRNWRGEEAI